MDDDTNEEATPEQSGPAEPSTLRILPETVWGTPNGGPKALVAEAAPQPAPDGVRSNLDEWYPESWWAWKRGSGSRTGAGSSTTSERSSGESARAVVSEENAADADQGQDVEAGLDHERPLFDGEELGSLPSAPTLDDEFAFLAPPAVADLDPESQPMDDAADSDESVENEEAGEDEESEAETPAMGGTGGQAIAWDAPSDQMDVPDQWVFGGSRFGGSRRKRSARPAAEGPKHAGKRSRLRRRHAEPEPSPLFGPEEEGEALASAGRDERGRA